MTRGDYLQYFNREHYLFDIVNRRFHQQHFLSAFDFFSIVIWKANRAKSKVAHRLLKHSNGSNNLEAVVRRLTRAIWECPNPSRLKLLRCDWGFGLPMSTAILSVCWPDEFSVYDVRVCEQLGDFAKLKNVTRPKLLWKEYQRFVKAVRGRSPAGSSLRDCDHYLWAKSGAEQLHRDIKREFQGRE
jgi:hypothetical protein